MNPTPEEEEFDKEQAERNRWLEGLRQLAALCEERNLSRPGTINIYEWQDRPVIATWYFSVEDQAQFAYTVKALPIDGIARKEATVADSYRVTIDVADTFIEAKVTLLSACEMVEVGTEEVEEVEEVSPAVTKVVKKTRPVYERRCPESLLVEV